MTNVIQKLDELLPPIIDSVSGNILAYAVILAAIATLTMTLLELVKGVLRLKYHYNKYLVKQWMRSNENSQLARATMGYLFKVNIAEERNTDAPGVATDIDMLYDQLIVLAVSDTKYATALFDQDTDKVMGQMQAVANIVLDYPDIYPDVYFMLTNTDQKYLPMRDRIARKVDRAEAWQNGFVPDNIKWMQYAIDRASPEAVRADTFGAETDSTLSEATKARARIEHMVARKLDALQAKMNFFWARLNQGVAIGGSFAFILCVLHYLGVNMITAVFLSILGGMMAPFAKDVVSALSGLRTKA